MTFFRLSDVRIAADTPEVVGLEDMPAGLSIVSSREADAMAALMRAHREAGAAQQ
jgi:hypothetical protein